MDGEPCAYDGKSGRWIYFIDLIKAEEGLFSASARIIFLGELRCKLAISVPHADRVEGLERLKRRCIDWIEGAEAEGTMPYR